MPDWDTLPKLDELTTTNTPRKRKPKWLILAVWFVLLGGLFAFIMNYHPGETPPLPPGGENAPIGPDPAKLAAQWSQIQAHAVAPARGPASAPYTMIEFGDFQCPPCGKTRPKIEAMLAKYPTQANLIFLNYPISKIHKWALPSAQAAMFAASQGKFWEMYDTLYQNQDNLEPGYYGDYATKIGLNKQQMEDAISSKKYLNAVNDDLQFANSLEVSSTPTVMCRDNKTGKIQVIPYGHGGDTLFKFLDNPPWAVSAKPAS